MLSQFENFIQQHHLHKAREKILVAVSGGLDSSVLARLCFEAGFKFAIAHCNFSLRGEESDLDEAFARNMAQNFKVKFYSKRFDTLTFAAAQKVSVQMAARELRYDWFGEISKKEGYEVVFLAHHKNDCSETMLINLIRGTGISGLCGIPLKRGKIVRPLLFASREELSAYAAEKKITYREDSSNASDDYLRNKIRHQLMPLLEELNPGLLDSLDATARHLSAVNQVFNRAMYTALKGLIKKNEIVSSELLGLHPTELFLYELLKPYGFNEAVCSSILLSLKRKGSGQQFFSATHRIVKDRKRLILSPGTENGSDRKKEDGTEFCIASDQKKILKPIALSIQKKRRASLKSRTSFVIPRVSSMAFLDNDKLKFPLSLRKWKAGDAFVPLGMKTRKKLSDFFTDNKFSLPEKENTWLLVSDKDIVWVVGRRIDERYKVTSATKVIRIFKIRRTTAYERRDSF